MNHALEVHQPKPGGRYSPFDANGEFIWEGEGLLGHAVRGAAATVSAAALSLALRVVPTVVLARLLTPADFGVMTMVTTFSLLLMSFGTSGFNEAVIQPAQMNRFLASNIFWITCAIGAVLTIGFAASGPLLARFFRNPLVAHVAVATSVAIFISGVATVHSALLTRAMRFTALAVNGVVGLVVYSAVAILLAWRGWGYWALVAAFLAQALSITTGVLWLCQMDSQPATAGSGDAGRVSFRRQGLWPVQRELFCQKLRQFVGWLEI